MLGAARLLLRSRLPLLGDHNIANARAAGLIVRELNGSLEAAAARVIDEKIEPEPKSGRQERLENLWNRFV